jgi:regulator of replication initiation timing
MSATVISIPEIVHDWQEWRTGTVVEIETIHQIVTKLSAEVSALQAELADLRAELARLRVINNTLREVER